MVNIAGARASSFELASNLVPKFILRFEIEIVGILTDGRGRGSGKRLKYLEKAGKSSYSRRECGSWQPFTQPFMPRYYVWR